MQLDFCYAIKYIHENADELGIDSSKIAVGGFNSGAQLVLGAMYRLRDLSPKVCDAVKFQILISPIVNRSECKTPEKDLEDWQKKYKKTENLMVELLIDKSKLKRFDWNIDIYPGRAPIKVIQKMPPCIICTSEFD